MKPKILPALVCSLALALTCCFETGQKYQGPTAEIQKGPLLDVVEASGLLRSTHSVDISVPKVADLWEFTISYIAQEGKEIQTGRPVISFDTKDLNEQLQLAQANLASELKALEKVQIEEKEALENLIMDDESLKVEVARAQRSTDLPAELSSRIEVEKLKRDLIITQAKKEMSESKVAQQRNNMDRKIRTQENRIHNLKQDVAELLAAIEDMTIKAPKDGLVVYHEGWRGNKPSPGDNVWMGQSLVEIPDLDHMEVLASIDEPDAGRIAVGQEVEIRLDANPERNFKGRVATLGRIFHEGSGQKPTTVFDAVITILEPDREIMRPGMTAKTRIIINRADEVVLVPEKAISYNGDKVSVQVVNKQMANRRSISLGRRASGFYEVVSGLKPGERVALSESNEETSK